MARGEPNRPEVERLRRSLSKLIGLCLVLLAVAVVAEVMLPSLYAALAAVAAAGLVAVGLGGAIAWVLAPDYASGRGGAARWAGSIWPYVTSATRWGLTAAGLGALLATTLPARLVAVDPNPSALPRAGWIAIVFGAVGVAVGLLEEWHSSLGTGGE